MAIGLLLTLLVANLFVGSRNTNTTTDELSRMQENIRFTYQLLTRSIRHAGYRSDPSVDPTLLFSTNAAITGVEGTGANPDTLTIAFQGSGLGAGTGDAEVVDCLGRAFDQNVTVVNTFTIEAGANGTPALFCTSSGGLSNLKAEVVPDVENMQILYGEDTDVGLDQNWMPNYFLPINQIANLNNVVAVRVALLFSTNNPSTRTGIDTATYNLNGVGLGPYNDKQIRRVVVWNINLRNRSPY
jgi:type IV pilus assembly protein PilW